MTAETLTPVHTNLDASNRVALPKQFSECVTSWMRGTVALRGWLLIISPGRYRLLSDEQVESDPHLEPIRALILEQRSAGTDPTSAEDPNRAAMVARLAPVQITPPGPCWRITLPKAFGVFAPPECDRKAVSVLFSLEGYLEIWYTDVLRTAVFSPLGQ
jgi:hypothetical protein